MSFTPRTNKSGMTATIPYNDHYYVGNILTGYFYNYSNSSNYQCTGYCVGRLGEIAGEPVTTYSAYPSTPTHRIFPNRTGFGDAKEWYGATGWDKTSDNTKPKLGAIVCYSSYPNDGGGGHVQIVEKIDGSTIYVSQNQTAYNSESSFLTAININDLSPYNEKAFQGYIYNPYVDEEPTPSGKDVLEFYNDENYAYVTFDGDNEESGYDYKVTLVAPYFALAGKPNEVKDSSVGSDWEFVCSINGGFFFADSGSYFANGLEKQHWTWNEQYDDTEYDSVLAVGGSGEDNTHLTFNNQGSMREYWGEWAITGGTSLAGGSRISSAVDSSTGHSFIGKNGTKIIMGISKSGVSGATLRTKINGMGYTGVELDGGGSTSFMYQGTQYSNTYDGRSVKNVLCLYKKKKSVTPTYYTVTLNVEPSDGGSVTGAGTYEKGTSVNISATPNKGYKFKQWSDGNTNAERTIEDISSDITLTAMFEKSKGIIIKGAMGIDFQVL